MRIALTVLAAWLVVSTLMAISWGLGARVGYRRAIEDVRQQALRSGDTEKVIHLDDVEKLVG